MYSEGGILKIICSSQGHELTEVRWTLQIRGEDREIRRVRERNLRW